MNKWLVLLILFFTLSGCVTIPERQETINDRLMFEKTPEYSIDLNTIEKPKKLIPQYALIENNTITFTSRDQATHIVLVPEEYAKVAELLNVTITYKSIIKEQEVLINTYIAEINSLKELLALQQEINNQYKQLWINSEKAYQQQKADYDRQSIISKIGYAITLIGGGVLLALAL